MTLASGAFCRNGKMLNESLLLNLEEVKVVACSIVSSLYTVEPLHNSHLVDRRKWPRTTKNI